MRYEDERNRLLDDVMRMLVEYDEYVENTHHLLINQAKQIVSATPIEIKLRPESELIEHWKYRVNPMLRRIADGLVSYIMMEKMNEIK